MKYYLFSVSTDDLSQRKYDTEIIRAANLYDAVNDLYNRYRYHRGLHVENLFVEDENAMPVAVKYMRNLINAVKGNKPSRLENALVMAGMAAGRGLAKPIIGAKPKKQAKNLKKT